MVKEIEEAAKALQAEHKMYTLKKVKIEDTIQAQKSKCLGLGGTGPGIIGRDADFSSAPTSLKNYERLADDYAHRRFVRKGGRIHGRRMF